MVRRLSELSRNLLSAGRPRIRYPRAISVLALSVAACGEAPTESAGSEPTAVVILSAERLPSGDVVTELENRGGEGAFRLVFIGTRPDGTSPACDLSILGESDAIEVGDDYAANVTWVVPSGMTAIVVALSKSSDSTEWRETSRFYIACAP